MKDNQTSKSADELLKHMVENTVMIITNDLPTLLGMEEVANYRRVHKDQILDNLPQTKAALLQALEDIRPEKKTDTRSEWVHDRDGRPDYLDTKDAAKGYNRAIDEYLANIKKWLGE